MDREQAKQYLSSEDPHNRLLAARYFSKNTTAADTEPLRIALRNEDVPWIRFALQKALDGASGIILQVPNAIGTDEEDRDVQDDDLYAKATEEISQRLVHELRPILKIAIYFA